MECICLLLLDIDVIPSNKIYLMIKAAKLSLRAIACLIVMILLACTNSSQTAVDKEGLVDVAEITQNSESYIGQSVLVRNDVLETIGERGLILDKDRVFRGKAILILAIDTSQMPSLFSKDRTPEVLVSGTVERFNLNDIEQKYGLNLEPNLYSQYKNQLVIIAKSLILSPDPEDLTGNPEIYYGKPLAIKGELEDIKSYGVFELDEEQAFGGEDLLVVQLKPRITLKEEQNAIVYGTLRPFSAIELERDYNLGWDLSIQEQIEAEYSQKPVLIAEKIQLLKR